MAQALGRDKDDTFVPGRQGMVGERTPGEIGIHAVRCGDIIGPTAAIICDWSHEGR